MARTLRVHAPVAGVRPRPPPRDCRPRSRPARPAARIRRSASLCTTGRRPRHPDAAIASRTPHQRTVGLRRPAGPPVPLPHPATGDRPMRFSVQDLPSGLTLDEATGIIRGSIIDKTPRGYQTTIAATNARGRAERGFRIVVGDTLALTPPMGWNDWYTFYEQPSRPTTDARGGRHHGPVGHGGPRLRVREHRRLLDDEAGLDRSRRAGPGRGTSAA